MTADPLALYVHWPFCLSKCPYCDFNSHVRDSVDQARWRAALLRDLDAAAHETAARPLTSIFFGGGTPSLMPPETAAAVISRAAEHWPFADDIEITLEANPTSVEAQRFADFRAAGINRVSLGVQALDDDALRALGRGHDTAEALAAVALAQRHFPRYSFDLIYARQGQTAAAWSEELDRALDLAGDHLSLYQLTIEPGTAFHRRTARGETLTAAEPTAAALYEITQQRLAAAGLPAYEISNHARPGGESRHNLTYWRYQDYLGIGPGAHGRVTLDGAKVAVQRIRRPEDWLDAVEAAGHGEKERLALNAAECLTETVLMGLRLTEGIRWERLEAGPTLAAERIADLVAGGFLVSDAAGLRATATGRQRLDRLILELLR